MTFQRNVQGRHLRDRRQRTGDKNKPMGEVKSNRPGLYGGREIEAKTKQALILFFSL